ncbi:MAG TPA: hypothetical protein VKW06_11390 [Candidatus Angelobacter sp.]|nr:hypothetical protein [Candidatus Angelobacter sp.]
MRKTAFIFLLICAVAGGAQKSLEELRAKAEKSSGGEQARLYAQIADLLVAQADQEFTQGDSARAHATVQEALENAGKARDLAIASHDKRKEVEILLRNTQRHLENVKRTLALVDRPPMDEAEKKLANLRQDLLDAMFAPKKKKEGP